MPGSWRPPDATHNMQADVTGFILEDKQSSFETITKKKPFILGRLSALCSIFNQVDVTGFYMAWWVDDPQREMHCPEQNISLSESSLLAATIIGMISCPCMDSIYWWEFEIGFRENHVDHGGLDDVSSLRPGRTCIAFIDSVMTNVGRLFVLCCFAK